MHKGEPVILTGNQIGSISVEYLCRHLQETKRLLPSSAFITTIVSTELIKTIASSWKAAYFEVLTGFKYIGEMIHIWEQKNNPYQFIFGMEESYGFLLGSGVARDKDAIISSCLFAEIALFAKLQGKTFVDLLEDIYKKYGIFREEQKSLTFSPGKEGIETMQDLMRALRSSPPQLFCKESVILWEDYLTGLRHLALEGKTEPLLLPKSDVLLFRLKNGSRLVIRPSGTEPKIKLYGMVRKEYSGHLAEDIAACDSLVQALLEDAAQKLQN